MHPHNTGGNASDKSGASRASHRHVEAQRFSCPDDRKLGILSVAFIIINSMIGTGIFAAPAAVFRATASVGLSLLLWLLGGLLALCGLSLSLEFGLALPDRSGGELHYLARALPRPRHLAPSLLAAQMVLLGVSAANAVAFGQLLVDACRPRAPDSASASASASYPGIARQTWAARGVGAACVTLAVALHAALPRWGVRLMNAAGLFKMVVMLVVAFAGFAALAGLRGTDDDPHNLDRPFAPPSDAVPSAGGFSAHLGALVAVAYSYAGWDSANHVLAEVRAPRRALAVAAPLAVGLVVALYLLANVAYFAAVPAPDLAASEALVAALFFKTMFGEAAAARTLPVFVAVSSLGSVLATSFAHSRLNQELAKQRILPLGKFWASNRPFNAPAASLLLHWIVTMIVLFAPPLGQSYDALVKLSVHPRACINLLLTVGLLRLQWTKSERWKSPWHTYLPISVVFLLFNGLLIIGPFVPPPASAPGKDTFFLIPLIGLVVLLSGVVYWAVWTKMVPRIRGYRIEVERAFGQDQDEVVHYRRVEC